MGDRLRGVALIGAGGAAPLLRRRSSALAEKVRAGKESRGGNRAGARMGAVVQARHCRLWLALIAVKVILAAIASAAGAPGGAGANGLLLALGVSLLAESAMVGPLAMATGVPFATEQDARRGATERSSRSTGRARMTAVPQRMCRPEVRPHALSYSLWDKRADECPSEPPSSPAPPEALDSPGTAARGAAEPVPRPGIAAAVALDRRSRRGAQGAEDARVQR